MVCGPAVSASPQSWLDIEDLGSTSNLFNQITFGHDPQVAESHFKVLNTHGIGSMFTSSPLTSLSALTAPLTTMFMRPKSITQLWPQTGDCARWASVAEGPCRRQEHGRLGQSPSARRWGWSRTFLWKGPIPAVAGSRSTVAWDGHW